MAEQYVKEPKDNRVRAKDRAETEGDVVKVRVNDMPLLRNFGMSKLQNYKEDLGDSVLNVELVDKETGRYDVTIDRKAKEAKEKRDYEEARGYAASDHKVVIEGTTASGKPMTQTAEVEIATGEQLFNALPSGDQSGSTFDE